MACQKGVFQGAEVLDNRLRVDAAEEGVPVGADFLDFDARAAQNVAQVAAAAAVHRVGDDVEAAGSDLF